MAGRWNRKAAYFLAINFPAFHPAGGRKDKDEQADLKRSDGVVEYWSFQSSNAPLFHHSDSPVFHRLTKSLFENPPGEGTGP